MGTPNLPSNVYQPFLGRNCPWWLSWTSSSAAWGRFLWSWQKGTVSGLWPHRGGAGTFFWQVRGPRCLELPQRTSEPISHSLFVSTLSLTLGTQRHLEESLQRGLSSSLGCAGENPETPLEPTWALSLIDFGYRGSWSCRILSPAVKTEGLGWFLYCKPLVFNEVRDFSMVRAAAEWSDPRRGLGLWFVYGRVSRVWKGGAVISQSSRLCQQQHTTLPVKPAPRARAAVNGWDSCQLPASQGCFVPLQFTRITLVSNAGCNSEVPQESARDVWRALAPQPTEAETKHSVLSPSFIHAMMLPSSSQLLI